MRKLLHLVGQVLEDFLIFIGLFLLVFTTYSLNTTIGHYFLGVLLVGLGVILAKRR